MDYITTLLLTYILTTVHDDALSVRNYTMAVRNKSILPQCHLFILLMLTVALRLGDGMTFPETGCFF